MKRIIILLGCLLLNTVTIGFAQEHNLDSTRLEQLEQRTKAIEDKVKKQDRFKFSGYIQTQFQHGEENASLKVGSKNGDADKSFNRIGIRRGRLKFTYEQGIFSGVFQLDITEKGVGFKDAYVNFKDPWVGTNAIRLGIFDRPFGYEISYSSSRRESPERSTIFQTLFPDERDLGAMLILQPSKNSPLNFLKLEAGLFAGNGIKQETDNRKDFIGHLSANKSFGSNFSLGLGASYYRGGVYQGTENVYTMQNNGFVVNSNTSNIGKFAKREYFGFDGQFSVMSILGLTQIRGEYLFGTQPGGKSSSKSPNSSTLPSSDVYVRKFSGGYVMLVQDLGKLPLSAVVKYDWYDPNTKVSKDEIGLNGTDIGDIAYNTLGVGLLWRATSSIRLQAYYEIVNNEKTKNLANYAKNLKDNIFTLRVQYKF